MKITATVVNRSNKSPIAHARVSLSIGTSEIAVLYSDDQGHFVYADDDPHQDQCIVCRVEKEGFERQEVSSVISPDNITLDIELIPLAQTKAREQHAKKIHSMATSTAEQTGLKMELQLKNESGRPASGIFVSCQLQGFEMVKGVSDDKGNVHIFLTKSETTL